ncbi:hypothetical protein LSUB1_G006355 [Lachnellula subtilissima]|uniref:Uncharacterized protein n=1 Tax=Lachnellula subtilissima TaxID=602034 RepID=A0A8H8RKC4_9HELO|nr:hypothetical protein LSUB1_G006355 [Lachnellula subtilissima]
MTIKQQASGLIAYAQSLVDRIISPSTRQNLYNSSISFAKEQPLLASFLAIQLSLSLTPLLLFTSFVLGVLSLSLISALLFSLFWIGVALLLLVPTLFVTVSLGLIVWIWAVSSFVVVRWVYNLVPVKGAAKVELVNGKVLKVEKREGEAPRGEVKNGEY